MDNLKIRMPPATGVTAEEGETGRTAKLLSTESNCVHQSLNAFEQGMASLAAHNLQAILLSLCLKDIVT